MILFVLSGLEISILLHGVHYVVGITIESRRKLLRGILEEYRDSDITVHIRFVNLYT